MEYEDEKTDRDRVINSYGSWLYWSQGTQSDHIAMLNAYTSWYSKMPVNFLADIKRFI